MTLSRGNGLMAAMTHLTPKERYQVVHYIREQFMKPTNPDYFKVDADYLARLPKGTEDGHRSSRHPAGLWTGAWLPSSVASTAAC